MTDPPRQPPAASEPPGDVAVDALYAEVRRLARGLMRGERHDHTLAPTALANEAWLRLFGGAPVQFADDASFLAAAVTALRRVLVEHGRARARHKRGGGRSADPQPVEDLHAPADDQHVLAVDEALQQLAAVDQAKARLVELRFFGGLSVDEAANVLGISPRSAARDWRLARAFLRSRLHDGGGDGLDD